MKYCAMQLQRNIGPLTMPTARRCRIDVSMFAETVTYKFTSTVPLYSLVSARIARRHITADTHLSILIAKFI